MRRISIRRIGSGQLVWQENTNLRPGCGELAAVTVLKAYFVALCGHQGGRHYTQKSTAANMFPGELTGPHYVPLVQPMPDDGLNQVIEHHIHAPAQP